MKKILLCAALCGCFYAGSAQSRMRTDTTGNMRMQTRSTTDSVKSGNNLYEGGKGQRGRSQGDTLNNNSRTRNNNFSGKENGGHNGSHNTHTTTTSSPK